MNHYEDAFERLAQRGTIRGAEKVWEDAHFALSEGTWALPTPKPRRRWNRPVVAGLLAFAAALGAMPLLVGLPDSRGPVSGSSSVTVPTSGLGASGEYFGLDGDDWMLISVSTNPEEPQETFSLYRREGATLTIATGSPASEQLDLLAEGRHLEEGVLRHQFDGGVGFSWSTPDGLPVVIVVNGLTIDAATNLAADVVAVDQETWNQQRASAGGDDGLSTATTVPMEE